MGRKRRQQKYEFVPRDIALTPIYSTHLHPPGMAIFNPLVDAPPDPPPAAVASYQHQDEKPRNETPVEDCEQGPAIPTATDAMYGHHRRPSNYYYSSQQTIPAHVTVEYKDIDYDLLDREQERHHRFRCRIFILMIVLVYISWSRKANDPSSPSSSSSKVPVAVPGQASMDFVHKDAILSSVTAHKDEVLLGAGDAENATATWNVTTRVPFTPPNTSTGTQANQAESPITLDPPDQDDILSNEP